MFLGYWELIIYVIKVRHFIKPMSIYLSKKWYGYKWTWETLQHYTH